MKKLKSSWKGTGSSSGLVVDEDDIADILADWTHIPAARLKEEEMERLKNLENILHARVIGQDEAVSAVAKKQSSVAEPDLKTLNVRLARSCS